MIAHVLTDIEGTTSSLSFVKDTLFPYAATHLPDYVRTHREEPRVRTEVLAVANDTGIDEHDEEAIIAQLLTWIDQDVKATPLKNLQGLIWQGGYESGDYQAHMYPDAVAWLKARQNEGVNLYVYSSGSVRAQELFFRYSDHGDLRKLFSRHFDTTVGKKDQVESYHAVANQCEINPEQTLFLSDVEAELDAARNADFKTARLLRQQDYGVLPAAVDSRHPVFSSFSEIHLTDFV